MNRAHSTPPFSLTLRDELGPRAYVELQMQNSGTVSMRMIDFAQDAYWERLDRERTVVTLAPRPRLVIDLFAGCGGWDEGLAMLERSDLTCIGIEMDRDACATRRAAGHRTIRADVASLPVEPFAGKVEGLIASPPCQSFSMAGNRKLTDDPRGQLVFEVMRWARALRPIWIACEQVPEVIHIWRLFARELATLGYSAWSGVLCAADFGVPQTRRRAILMAHRHRKVRPPPGTHSELNGTRIDGADLLPWVKMADALGWGMTARPSPTVTIGHGEPFMAGSRRRMANEMREGRWERPLLVDRRTNSKGPKGTMVPTALVDGSLFPAPTLTGKSGQQWIMHRPATTLCGDSRIPGPGHHGHGEQLTGAISVEQMMLGDCQGNEPIKLTIEQALILQSFRPDYPVRGTKTQRFKQVGNALCPELASAVLGALV